VSGSAAPDRLDQRVAIQRWTDGPQASATCGSPKTPKMSAPRTIQRSGPTLFDLMLSRTPLCSIVPCSFSSAKSHDPVRLTAPVRPARRRQRSWSKSGADRAAEFMCACGGSAAGASAGRARPACSAGRRAPPRGSASAGAGGRVLLEDLEDGRDDDPGIVGLRYEDVAGRELRCDRLAEDLQLDRGRPAVSPRRRRSADSSAFGRDRQCVDMQSWEIIPPVVRDEKRGPVPRGWK